MSQADTSANKRQGNPHKNPGEKTIKKKAQWDLFDDGGDDDQGKQSSSKPTVDSIASPCHSFGEYGWNWSEAPIINKPSQKDGMIVFNVVINKNGQVSSVVPKKYTVAYELMVHYQEHCHRLRFTRKNDANIPDTTKATITFIFKTR